MECNDCDMGCEMQIQCDMDCEQDTMHAISSGMESQVMFMLLQVHMRL